MHRVERVTNELRFDANGVLQQLVSFMDHGSTSGGGGTYWRDVPREVTAITESKKPLLRHAAIGSAWRARNGTRAVVTRHRLDALVEVEFDTAPGGSHCGVCGLDGRFSTVECSSDIIGPWIESQKPDIDARIKVLEAKFRQPFTNLGRCYRGNGPEWKLTLYARDDSDGKCEFHGDTIESVISQAEENAVNPRATT